MADLSSASQQHSVSIPPEGALLALDEEHLVVAWGSPTRHVSPPNEAYFYAPDFCLTESHPYLTFPRWKIVERGDLEAFWKYREGPREEVWRWQEPDFDQFTLDFYDIKEHLSRGALKKAVPVVFAHSPIPEPGWLQRRIAYLMGVSSPSYLYGLWTQESGVLGLTPELLFRCDRSEGRLQTMALAGTRLKDQETDAEFLADPKELGEHNWVVKALRERLEPTGDLKVLPTEVLDLGPLRHLMTRIEVVSGLGLEEFSKLVRLLHPTPALGAYPTEEAPDWLWERPVRGFFGAPFAFVDPGRFEHCVVGIRNIQWERGTVRLGSGCGIVAASDLNREWLELSNKRQAVRELLDL